MGYYNPVMLISVLVFFLFIFYIIINLIFDGFLSFLV